MAERLHVLVVEDDPLVLDTIRQFLESDFRISSAVNVGDACACLRTSHLDLALVDYLLPGGRGETVIKLAMELGVPVVEMSGYPQEILAMEGSPRPHLTKPFRMNELLATVKAALKDGAQRIRP
jgi:DNA-binding response OmpR family regulator